MRCTSTWRKPRKLFESEINTRDPRHTRDGTHKTSRIQLRRVLAKAEAISVHLFYLPAGGG